MRYALQVSMKGTSSRVSHHLHSFSTICNVGGISNGSPNEKAVIGSNCVRSLALLLATAAIGGIFASFATDLGEKVS